MTVSTFYSETSDGEIVSGDTSYTQARAGTGTDFSVDNTATLMTVGQRIVSSKYWCYESFISWDTSSLPDSDVISAAVVTLGVATDSSTTDFVIEARLFDFGTTLTTADWVAGASLSSYTVLALQDTVGITSVPVSWNLTSEPEFVSNVSKTGKTRVLFNSSRHRTSIIPSGNEYIRFRSAEYTGTAQDPILTITHSGDQSAAVTPATVAATTAVSTPVIGIGATPSVVVAEAAVPTPSVVLPDTTVDLSTVEASVTVQVPTIQTPIGATRIVYIRIGSI